MLAARWPDDVRRKYREYDRPKWHYVNIPYLPGENEALIPEGDSIITAFPENRSIVGSASADGKARAVAVCWMLHLIGDTHQPLHTIKLVTKQFPEPEGDRGGTRFYIRVWPNASTISLHKFWDDLILGSGKFQGARNKASKLRNNPALKRENFAEQLAVSSFNDWATATYRIAVEDAYRNGTLEGSNDKEDGVALPNSYSDKAKEIAERQIVLSGYRISDAMIKVFDQ